MSAQPAIAVRDLGKRYRLGQALSLDDGLREVLARAMTRWRDGARTTSEPQRDLWALRDVSFDIAEGSAVGIVGRNGAGKSTLLKVLGRITAPTTGEVRINGRVASLLEVGTGFQPDLTGRENVFLNGAILGMRRRTVARRFDEIIAFAGVERFVDTPVKRYSSGMFMRLAFAVAAHLDARILLIDEVLAVGDVEFQNRCLAKMDALAGSGRTVVFVSHNLGAVRRLCQRALYLDAGRLVTEAPVTEALARYLRDAVGTDGGAGRGSSCFRAWRLQRRGAGDPHACISGEPVVLEVTLELDRPLRGVSFQLELWGAQAEVVMSASSRDDGGAPLALARGAHTLRLETRFPLREGDYLLELTIADSAGVALDRVQLPPRLLLLPGTERALPRSRRGIVEETVRFQLDPAPTPSAVADQGAAP